MAVSESDVGHKLKAAQNGRGRIASKLGFSVTAGSSKWGKAEAKGRAALKPQDQNRAGNGRPAASAQSARCCLPSPSSAPDWFRCRDGLEPTFTFLTLLARGCSHGSAAALRARPLAPSKAAQVLAGPGTAAKQPLGQNSSSLLAPRCAASRPLAHRPAALQRSRCP